MLIFSVLYVALAVPLGLPERAALKIALGGGLPAHHYLSQFCPNNVITVAQFLPGHTKRDVPGPKH